MQEIQETRVWSPVFGGSPGGGHGNPFQYSCLENPLDRCAWWATVHGIIKNQIWLKRLSTRARLCNVCCRLCLATQLCPTLCDPVDCSPPGSSVQGERSVLQNRSGMYMHVWVPSLFTRNYHNTVNQLYFNTKLKKINKLNKPKRTRLGELRGWWALGSLGLWCLKSSVPFPHSCSVLCNLSVPEL